MCCCGCPYEDWYGDCTRGRRIPWNGVCRQERRAERAAEEEELRASGVAPVRAREFKNTHAG